MNPFPIARTHPRFGRVFLVMPPLPTNHGAPSAEVIHRFERWGIPIYPWNSGCAVVCWSSNESPDYQMQSRRLLSVLKPESEDSNFNNGFERVWQEWEAKCESDSRTDLSDLERAERCAYEMGLEHQSVGHEAHVIWNWGWLVMPEDEREKIEFQRLYLQAINQSP